MGLLLQNIVHLFEEGKGARYLRVAACVLVALFVIVGYNLRAYRNFSTAEAMDQAQLARNLAEGRGYTTQCVRPFSMYLLKRTNRERLETLTPEQKADLCMVKTEHPDLANPPVYPLLLAGLMKAGLVPKSADTTVEKKLAFENGYFVRYLPDFTISLWNQFLLLLVVVVTFFLARQLFDAHVALLSSLLVLAADQLWRFSVSGLSTMLLLLLFMGLIWALVRFEAVASDPEATARRVLVNAALLGALLGVGMLTRYAYGILILPALIFVVAFGGRWRVPAAILTTLLFVLVVAPWMARNIQLCGEPFGTAGYAPIEGSFYFQGDRLQRSLEPNLSRIALGPLWWKFFHNLRQLVFTDLPTLGGGFVFGFFLVGLMIPFRRPALSRMRYFLLGALISLMCAQALGRTWLADESPVINTENLIVLVLPLVVVYGTGLFQILLDQLPLPTAGWRGLVAVVFCAVVSLPMLFAFLPPRTNPVSFPPYHPPSIQKVSAWMKDSEMTMSDVPWAVAWYGNRQSMLMTLGVSDDSDFYRINDYVKPVSALYLTPRSLDAKFLSQWARGGSDASWGGLIISSLNREVLPVRFPLVKAFRLPEQLYLTDWDRWLKPAAKTDGD
jgi:4-amino-4-deoxy-L-arabinose transferase-like glycosyltransferase